MSGNWDDHFGTYFFYVYFCGPNSITDTGIGHLIKHMGEQSLKNGFISTYRSTVFVRRTDDYRLELSIPVNEQSTNLSVRECLAGLCALAARDTSFNESDDFDKNLVSVWAAKPRLMCVGVDNREQLSSPNAPDFQHPSRDAYYLVLEPDPAYQGTVPETVPLEGGGRVVGRNTIVFDPEGVARPCVDCVEVIYGTLDTKGVMKVRYGDGCAAIAKCWCPGPKQFKRFVSSRTISFL